MYQLEFGMSGDGQSYWNGRDGSNESWDGNERIEVNKKKQWGDMI